MKTTKRILAILLTFCTLLTSLCLPAFAVDAVAAADAPELTTTTKTSVLNNIGEGQAYNLETVLGEGVSGVEIVNTGDDCILMRGEITGGGQANAYCNKLEEDGFVVIDYKTGSLKPKYQRQLELYRRCLELATGETVKETHIYPLI